MFPPQIKIDDHMIGFRKVRIHSQHTIAWPLAVLQVNDTSDMHIMNKSK